MEPAHTFHQSDSRLEGEAFGGGGRGRLSRSQALVSALVLAALSLAYVRIFFGVDFADEAWYAANSYRYVLGDRPYVDEKNVTQQTSSVLLYPFTWAWSTAIGREGIILYFRHLYVGFCLALAAVLWLALHRIVPGRAYLPVAATMPVALLPLGIPSLSYNTLACGGFLAGSFGVLAACLRSSPALAAGSALLHGVAVFAYPPLILPVTVQLGLAAGFLRPGRRVLVALAAPVAASCLGLLALFLSAGVGVVRGAVSDSSEYIGHAGGGEKLHQVVEGVSEGFPWGLVAVVLILLAWLLRSRVPSLAAFLLVLLVVAAKPPGEVTTATSTMLVGNYSLLAVGLYPFIRGSPYARPLLAAVWLPAIAAGTLVAYSSANGAINFGLGSAPGAVVTLLFVAAATEQILGRAGPARAVSVAAVSLVLGVLFVLQWLDVYRDGPIGEMTVRIEEGPYKGLRTTPIKMRFLDEVAGVVEPLDESSSVLFYDEFPAGYLLTRARPRTSLVWTHPAGVYANYKVAGYRAILFAHFRRTEPPDFVVQVRRGPLQGAWLWRVPYVDGDPMMSFLARRYEPVGGRNLVLYARAAG